jgi:uncharacterized protein YndB with AHSA1/START domain
MTPRKHALRIERTFDAPREAVFRAWTEREQLLRWSHFNDDWKIVDVETDLHVGGSYRISWRAPDGAMWYELGEYREITPPERLVKMCRFDFPDLDEAETLLTIEFHERGAQTLVILVQEGYRHVQTRDNHQSGWPGFMNQLDAELAASASRA